MGGCATGWRAAASTRAATSLRAAAERRSATWIEMLRSAFDLAQSALDLDGREFVERLPAACAQVGAQLGGTLVYIDRVDVPARRLVNVAGWGSDADQQKLPQGDSLDFDALPAWIERLLRPRARRDRWRRARAPGRTSHQKAAVLGGGHPEIAVSMTAAGELFGVLGACRERGNPFTADEVAYVRLIGETIAHVLERARLDDALRAQRVAVPPAVRERRRRGDARRRGTARSPMRRRRPRICSVTRAAELTGKDVELARAPRRRRAVRAPARAGPHLRAELGRGAPGARRRRRGVGRHLDVGGHRPGHRPRQSSTAPRCATSPTASGSRQRARVAGAARSR